MEDMNKLIRSRLDLEKLLFHISPHLLAIMEFN